jgi:hypothetical protein
VATALPVSYWTVSETADAPSSTPDICPSGTRVPNQRLETPGVGGFRDAGQGSKSPPLPDPVVSSASGASRDNWPFPQMSFAFWQIRRLRLKSALDRNYRTRNPR